MRQWLVRIAFHPPQRDTVELLLDGSGIQLVDLDGETFLSDPALRSDGDGPREDMRQEVEQLVRSLSGLGNTVAACHVEYRGLAWLDDGVFGTEVTRIEPIAWRVLANREDVERYSGLVAKARHDHELRLALEILDGGVNAYGLYGLYEVVERDLEKHGQSMWGKSWTVGRKKAKAMKRRFNDERHPEGLPGPASTMDYAEARTLMLHVVRKWLAWKNDTDFTP